MRKFTFSIVTMLMLSQLMFSQVIAGGSKVARTGVQNQSYSCANDSGAADAYAITLTPVPSAYAAYQRFCFKAVNANATTSPTLNVNSLGTKTITAHGGGALIANDIKAGQIVDVEYDGTVFQLQSLRGNAGATQAGIQNESYSYAADTGAANAYVITLSPAVGAYAAGQLFCFKATNANSAASTLNVNGLGTKTIKKPDGGVTTDLAANDILAGQDVCAIYDGTNLQMTSRLGNAPGGGGGGVTDTIYMPIWAGRTGTGQAQLAANGELVCGFYVGETTQISKINVLVDTGDGTGLYSLGIYNSSGTLVTNASTTPASHTNGGGDAWDQSFAGTVNLSVGKYYIGWAGNSTTMQLDRGSSAPTFFNLTNWVSSSGGAVASSFSAPSDTWTTWGSCLAFILH